METSGEVVVVTLVLLIIFGFAVWAIWYSRKRNRANAEQAQALGFTPQPRPGTAFVGRIKQLYRLSEKVSVSNVSMKRVGEAEVYLCDVSMSGREADSGDSDYRTVCVCSPRLDLPYFLLVYRFDQVYAAVGKWLGPLFESMVQARGLQSVPFDDAPEEFRQKYSVFSNDMDQARALFSDAIIARLIANPEWLLRGEGDLLAFNRYRVKQGKTLTQEELNEQVNLALQIYEWFKR